MIHMTVLYSIKDSVQAIYLKLNGLFLAKDMQFMIDAECAESKEKSYFRFFRLLFFLLFGKFIENWGYLSTKTTKNDHKSK